MVVIYFTTIFVSIFLPLYLHLYGNSSLTFNNLEIRENRYFLHLGICISEIRKTSLDGPHKQFLLFILLFIFIF